MEQIIPELLKIVGGMLFFIYGLPALIVLICATCTWILDKIPGTKGSDKHTYSTDLLDESKAFMYGRR